MRLVVKKSNRTLKEFNLSKEEISIGRLSKCDICLPAGTVSRRHAVISSSDGKFFIHDLGSSNKSFLNGKAIEQANLKSGDELAIAEYRISIFFDGKKKPADKEMGEQSTEVAASLGTPKHETVVRKPDAQHAPAMRLTAKRLTDFSQATQVLSEAENIGELLGKLVDVVLRQFQGFHVWCGLRDQPSGPLVYQLGKRRDGKEVDLDSIQLKGKITNALSKKQSLVLPRVSAQAEEEVRIRSAMIVPITQKDGCIGVIYVDNPMVCEHYALGDLDYLMFLAMHTGAILRKLD